MNWLVNLAGGAYKAVRHFPAKDQRMIMGALDGLVLNPYSGDIEKIAGEINTWRRRVGNYRMIYDIDVGNKSVEVRIIKRRTSNTY